MKNKWIKNAGTWIFILLVPGPVLLGIGLAFAYATGLTGILSHGFTLIPLRSVLSDGEVLSSLLYSLGIAALAIGLASLISISLIVLLKDKLVQRHSVYWLYLPLAFPAIVSAFFSFEMLGKSGVLSRAAFQLHFISDRDRFPDLINDRFAIGIILTHLCMALPFFILYFSNLYQSLRVADLENIAASLGARKHQIAGKVIFPALLRQGRPVLLLYFIFVCGSYEIPLLLGRQAPQMISVLVVRKLQRFNLEDMPQGYWITLIYLLTILSILCVFFVFRKKAGPL